MKNEYRNLDVMLPGKNGIEVLREIREAKIATPILPKPFGFSEVLAVCTETRVVHHQGGGRPQSVAPPQAVITGTLVLFVF